MGAEILRPNRADIPEDCVSPSMLVARVVWLEIKRREEYLALFILMGIYLLIALGARLVGETQPEAVALMLNMGLFLSSALAAVLTLLTAARLIPSEIENRTLYPLLAKPLHRRDVILGKFVATIAAGVGVFLGFTLLTTLTWAQKFPLPGQDLLMFVQSAVLQMVALGLVASIALLLSLILPKGSAILLTGVLYFGGDLLLNLFRSLTRDSFAAPIADGFAGCFPHFSKLNLLQRFTDGAPPLLWGEFFGLILYGLIPTLVFLGLASHLFERREI